MTDKYKSTFAMRVRAAKPHARKYDVWDDVVSGLGLRVGTSGHRSFFLRRSVRGRIRSATIGSADTLTVPEVRHEARKLLATFIEPARNDNGPRTPGHPMDAFAGEQRLPRAQVHHFRNDEPQCVSYDSDESYFYSVEPLFTEAPLCLHLGEPSTGPQPRVQRVQQRSQPAHQNNEGEQLTTRSDGIDIAVAHSRERSRRPPQAMDDGWEGFGLRRMLELIDAKR